MQSLNVPNRIQQSAKGSALSPVDGEILSGVGGKIIGDAVGKMLEHYVTDYGRNMLGIGGAALGIIFTPEKASDATLPGGPKKRSQ